ncbi:hypothetical protein C8Q78DRAFT_597052 [Trametes maxima]|nr:hypothetical protein C8Q78DRAFT_597052 [Trametes maxima]
MSLLFSIIPAFDSYLNPVRPALRTGMTTKHLIFKTADLGTNIRISLSFAPPKVLLPVKDPLFPIFDIPASGIFATTITWSNRLAFCVPKFEENFVPIKAGQGTVLMGNPPTPIFTPPVTLPGVDTVQVLNQTNSPTDIGLGYIVDGVILPAAVWQEVGKNFLLVAEMEPVLRAYVEDQGVAAPIVSAVEAPRPIWEQNLLSLGPSTLITITVDGRGGYLATQFSVNAKDAMTTNPCATLIETRTKIFRAEIAFEDANAASRDGISLCKALSAHGYAVDCISKARSAELSVVVTVPHDGNCDDAEKCLMTAIEEIHSATMLVIDIKGHTGEVLVQGEAESSFSLWLPINPCDREWRGRVN